MAGSASGSTAVVAEWRGSLVSGDADGGAAEAEVVLPAQRDVVGLAGLGLPGVDPWAVLVSGDADSGAAEAEAVVPAEIAEIAEIAEETELGRDSGGGEASGGFGGSEGSGLGVHLRSVGGASREHGVPCGVCLVETWNVCAICDSCHSECRLAR